MRQISLLFFTIACAAGVSPTSRIYGGQNATSGQFPFMVALNEHSSQYCNGVIVSPNWVLTTAFCIYYRYPSAQAYFGSRVNQVNGTSYKFSERVAHREYDGWIAKNDIALIKINGIVEYGDDIQPIELGESPDPDTICTIVGFGSSEIQVDPPLQYVETTIIDLALCQNISTDYLGGNYLGSGQVCTLSSTGQGACYGDQGGALMCAGKLSGIYSYRVGFECDITSPDVFTDIASYSDWILSFI